MTYGNICASYLSFAATFEFGLECRYPCSLRVAKFVLHVGDELAWEVSLHLIKSLPMLKLA